MAVRQDINVGLVAFVGLVGAMLLLIAVWGVEGWYAYEVDLLTGQRHDTDRNLDWMAQRDEQYGNLGDPVGNATIYASADAGEEALGGSGGYRFTSRERDVAAIPIHAAMAQIVRQYGNQDVTVEQMRAADLEPVRIVNRLYAEYMTPQQPPGQAQGTAPATRPATAPARE